MKPGKEKIPNLISGIPGLQIQSGVAIMSSARFQEVEDKGVYLLMQWSALRSFN
jgi:hypothetical protein